jgi:hypothetical protein
MTIVTLSGIVRSVAMRWNRTVRSVRGLDPGDQRTPRKGGAG